MAHHFIKVRKCAPRVTNWVCYCQDGMVSILFNCLKNLRLTMKAYLVQNKVCFKKQHVFETLFL